MFLTPDQLFDALPAYNAAQPPRTGLASLPPMRHATLLALLFPLLARAGYPIPGRIEAERFRPGGEGVGYHDSTPGNRGRAFRAREDVDLAADPSASGGFFVSWITRGEWLRYEIEAAFEARFALTLRVSTPYEGRRLHVELDGENVTRSLPVPRTGAWNRFADTPSRVARVGAGRHELRVFFETDGLSLDAIDFRLLPDAEPVDAGPAVDSRPPRDAAPSAGATRSNVGGM